MGERLGRDEAGNLWVIDGQGNPLRPAQSPAMGPSIGNDPKLPGALQGQGLQNTKTQLDIANNPLTVANAKTNIAQGQNSISQSRIGNVQELRKEFNALPEVKNYSEVLAQMGKAMRAPKGPQGDLAVIYAFAKAMDPGSVVREGEMDMANSTGSIISQLKVKYKSFAEGKGLPPEVRQGLIESIRASGRAMNESYAQRYRQYRDQAVELGANPKQVVGNHLGDAFRPLEENYVKQNGGTDKNLSSAPSLNMDGNAIIQDHSPGSVQGSDTGLIGLKGGSHTETFPGLEGANGIVNAMLKAHRPIQEIAGYLKAAGAPDDHIAGVVQKANEIQQWQAKNPDYKGDFDINIERQQVPNSGFQNFGNSDVGTGALLGGNAALGGLPGALFGAQDQIEASRQAHPKASLAGEVAGAIGGTLGVNKALSAIPSKYLAANPAKQLLAADAIYGGTYGATQNPDNPGMGALLGAGAGIGGNVIGSKIIAPVLRGAGSKLGFGTPALPAGEGMVASQALKANPQEVLGKLQDAADLKLPYSLADADPRLRSLAGSAVRKSPDALALASETVGPRGMGQAERALGLIGDNLAQPGDINAIASDATKRAQSASKGLYGKAMEQAAPDDPALSELLRTPAGEQAARDAYSRALNAGEKPGDLSFEVDSITGQPRVTGNPNWRTLQYMKFELDRAAKADPTLSPLNQRFTGRLGELNPDFKAANARYAGIAKQGEAAQSGYGATAPRVTPTQIAQSLAGMKPDQLPYFQQGYASSLADQVERGNLSRDPFEAIFGSTAQRAKLGQTFPEGIGPFAKARGLEKDMSLTSRELLGGSPTQPRAEADKLFEGGGMDLAQDAFALAAGTPPINMMRSKLFAGRGVFGAAADTMRMGLGKSAQQKADQIAPILLNQNPEETSLLLSDLIRRQALRDAYVRQTGMFGSSVAAPTAITLTGR